MWGRRCGFWPHLRQRQSVEGCSGIPIGGSLTCFATCCGTREHPTELGSFGPTCSIWVSKSGAKIFAGFAADMEYFETCMPVVHASPYLSHERACVNVSRPSFSNLER